MRNVERRFSFRSGRLYDVIVERAREAGEDGVDWIELLGSVDEWAEATVEGAIRDLQVLGMLSIGGKPGTYRRPNRRRVWISPLGEAALKGERYVLPWSSRFTPDQ